MRWTLGRSNPGAITLAVVLAIAAASLAWAPPAEGRLASVTAAAAPADGRPLSLHLVVGAASDLTTDGYWVVASNGGVFSFGAPFFGSAGALPLVRPVVGMAATPDGGGYWLVASDGGIFSFGDARFHGSTGAITLHAPVVGMQGHPGGGYWLVARDGGIFSFGAPFEGSAAGTLGRGAVGLSVSLTGGYRVVSSDGSLSAFGGAPLLGSVHVPPLVGETVAVDPGHDGGNAAASGSIGRPIDGGNFTESCDTVGTETGAGFSEHAFNFDVGTRLAALLTAAGATVVMTRTTDAGVGPCVNVRAAIGNAARADAAISVHADGGPPGGRGFDVIEPMPVVSPISNNTGIIAGSGQLGAAVRSRFASDTGEPASDYSGSNGIDHRSDLGGLNLTTVPKVLIECANMQNQVDAGLTESGSWRQQAAQGLADGISTFLAATERP